MEFIYSKKKNNLHSYNIFIKGKVYLKSKTFLSKIKNFKSKTNFATVVFGIFKLILYTSFLYL